MKLTKYEQETIINYNQEEATCEIWTADKALQRRLDKLCLESSIITRENRDEYFKRYICPKKWIKVKKPREYTGENRVKAIFTTNQL